MTIVRRLSKTQASLAYIYIFDIASTSWSVQATIDIDGRLGTVLGSDPPDGLGLPEERDHMCTVVGEAADESSYNLYLFGGKNDSNAMDDIWVLSLPR